MSYAEVVTRYLGRHVTYAAVALANMVFPNFKPGTLKPWDFSEKLQDRTLRCSGIYNG